MKNNEPAFPTPYTQSELGINRTDFREGITKREYIATKVLCSLISYSHEDNVPNEPNIKGDITFSVKITDWLLEELNKEGS